MRYGLAALFIGCAGLAQAGAFYTTTASSEFVIGGPVTVVAGPSVPDELEIGAGMAGSGGIVSASGVLPATKSIGTTGIAPFPVSVAASSFQSGHIITIDNAAGTTPLFLAFTFSYGYSVMLGADGPGDYATGGAFFHITGIDNETLTIFGVPAAEYLFHPTFDTLLGGTGGMGGAVITGGVSVPAFSVGTFSVVTDTAGYAESVPEPGTLFLAIPAVLVLALGRRPAIGR